MQIYIPFSDFVKSAKFFSDKDLRHNIKNAHMTIHGKMVNMPCSVMWFGATKALKIYFNALLTEYKSRGFKHKFDLFQLGGIVQMPLWMDDRRVHFTHIVNLVRNNPPFYLKKCHIPDYEYPEGLFWPMPNGEKTKHDAENWINFFSRNNVYVLMPDEQN